MSRPPTLVIAGAVAALVLGCGVAAGQSRPNAVRFVEMEFDLPPGSWTQDEPDPAARHVGFARLVPGAGADILAVWRTSFGGELASWSRAQHVQAYWEHERTQGRPMGSRWENVKEGTFRHDGREFDWLSHDWVHPGSADGRAQLLSLLLPSKLLRQAIAVLASDRIVFRGYLALVFPPDFDERLAFYTLQWLTAGPAGEGLPQEFRDVVASFSVGPPPTARLPEAPPGSVLAQLVQHAASHDEISLSLPTEVLVVHPNPYPFCYAYRLQGDWLPAGPPSLYVSPDGLTRLGVLLGVPEQVRELPGEDLVQRVASHCKGEYEFALGRELEGIELVPFEAPRGMTVWRWSAAEVSTPERVLVPATKYIVDYSPLGFALITVGGDGDHDELARGVLDSMSTTREPTCYWPMLEAMFGRDGEAPPPREEGLGG